MVEESVAGLEGLRKVEFLKLKKREFLQKKFKKDLIVIGQVEKMEWSFHFFFKFRLFLYF